MKEKLLDFDDCKDLKCKLFKSVLPHIAFVCIDAYNILQCNTDPVKHNLSQVN